MKKKTKIILGIICSIVLVAAVIIGGFSIHSNYENNKLQAYLADTSNPPKALKNPNEWVETFHDDFNYFDTSKWKNITFKEKGNSRRAAYYSGDKESVFTKDGNLYLRTEWKEGKYGEGWYSAFLTTSQNLYSEYNEENFKGFSQKNGYFEIRCKVPATYSMWSAFWLMPENKSAFLDKDIPNSAADGVEIDVLESFYYVCINPKSKYSITPAIHSDAYKMDHKTLSSDYIFIPNLYNEFHTFGVLWEGNSYSFFVDGKLIWKTKHIINGKDMGPCLTPEYLILSTEVMGYKEDNILHEGNRLPPNANLIDKIDHWNTSPKRNSKNEPHDFIVDYVRVYEKK